MRRRAICQRRQTIEERRPTTQALGHVRCTNSRLMSIPTEKPGVRHRAGAVANLSTFCRATVGVNNGHETRFVDSGAARYAFFLPGVFAHD